MLNSPVGYCIFWYCCQSEPHLFRELVVDGTAGGGRRWSRKLHGMKTQSPRRKNKHGKLGTPHQKPRFSWENNGNILEYIIMTHCRLKHGTEQFHFSSINLSKIDMKSQKQSPTQNPEHSTGDLFRFGRLKAWGRAADPHRKIQTQKVKFELHYIKTGKTGQSSFCHKCSKRSEQNGL